MDIVITGRRIEVAERFRAAVQDKLAKVETLAPKTHRVDVELSQERNPRQSHTKRRVEITVRGRGPVIRAEASAEDSLAALDLALGKLLERLRRSHDRRKVHHGRHTPETLRRASDAVLMPPLPDPEPLNTSSIPAPAQNGDADGAAYDEDLGDPGSPVVIRVKDHEAIPMTLDQALYEMELVGHDFYLYVDAGCGRPSVVYRRRGWNYGVIRLDLEGASAGSAVEQVQDLMSSSA